MTEQEYQELRQIILATHPGERLDRVLLGGGRLAIRMNVKGSIVWNRQDWEQTYLGIKPVRKEEVEA